MQQESRQSSLDGPVSPRFPPGSDLLLIQPPPSWFLRSINFQCLSSTRFGENSHWITPDSVNATLCLVQSGLFVQHPVHRADRLGTVPPSSVPFPDGCLSVSLSGEAAAASVNKCLIFPLLVPVCLSVCLTCQQLSRRSGVAVSHVLVSLLLSVHLPVRDSQIRHVSLPLGFPVLKKSFIKSQQAGNMLFSLLSKLIMVLWYVIFVCLYIEHVQMHEKHFSSQYCQISWCICLNK